MSGRLWVTLLATQPRENEAIRVQVPFEWLQSGDSILAPLVQSEITRQHIELRALAQSLYSRPIGEKLEVMKMDEPDTAVRVGLEHRAPPSTTGTATQLQLQVSEDREDGTRIDMTLPLPLARTLLEILSDYEYQGDKVLPEVQQLVNLDKVIDRVSRQEPFELVSVEEPGFKLMLRSR